MQLFLQSELTVTAYIAVRSSIRYVRSKTPRDSEMLPRPGPCRNGRRKTKKSSPKSPEVLSLVVSRQNMLSRLACKIAPPEPPSHHLNIRSSKPKGAGAKLKSSPGLS